MQVAANLSKHLSKVMHKTRLITLSLLVASVGRVSTRQSIFHVTFMLDHAQPYAFQKYAQVNKY